MAHSFQRGFDTHPSQDKRSIQLSETYEINSPRSTIQVSESYESKRSSVKTQAGTEGPLAILISDVLCMVHTTHRQIAIEMPIKTACIDAAILFI